MPDDDVRIPARTQISQDDIFAGGEGDRWFLRNREGLTNEAAVSSDMVLRLLDVSGVRPSRVLEIGASNGYRLDRLRAAFDCEVTAVEPSSAAIEDGRRRYPSVVFRQGVASALPIEGDGTFDLVIVNFVFHWMDRSTLLRSVAEIDRMVAGGGFLVVGDFFPPYPMRVAYHHLPDREVWTYKQAYAEMFIASVIYREVAALTFDHGTHEIRSDSPPGDRARAILLRKSLDEGYAPATREP